MRKIPVPTRAILDKLIEGKGMKEAAHEVSIEHGVTMDIDVARRRVYEFKKLVGARTTVEAILFYDRGKRAPR